MQLPVAKTIQYQNPAQIAEIFADSPWMLFLDSCPESIDRQELQSVGRYSYILLAPYIKVISKNGLIHIDGKAIRCDLFGLLDDYLTLFQTTRNPNLPPFQGGLAGIFSYDLARTLETLPTHATDDAELPDCQLGFYDTVIAFDHLKESAWIIANGFPAQVQMERISSAHKRIDEIEMALKKSSLQTGKQNSPVTPTLTHGKISSPEPDLSQEEYCRKVMAAKNYIRNGDIFQVNLSQRFQCKTDPISPYSLYRVSRLNNPAAFSAFCQFDDYALLSASPERFIAIVNQQIETRPIKGTIKRSHDAHEDEKLKMTLLSSEKDIAENMMIVDLMRNDLSKVALPHSVRVEKLCSLESNRSVHHLVSVVKAELNETFRAIDALKACFPGGSITGAPKIRSMEIIDTLEPTRRGPYCGSIGYIGFNGNLDTSIVIRTMIMKARSLSFQVGGAVTLDSNPSQEYEETLAKASGIMNTLKQFNMQISNIALCTNTFKNSDRLKASHEHKETIA